MKINAVVVTYNRIKLLKECLEALLIQTYPIQKIIVIDNCSTDETAEYLKRFVANDYFQIIRTEENLGGSGGFSLGLKESVLSGCDYTWLMDDDTIPMSDALERLVEGLGIVKEPGFVCSRVNWTNGEEHRMNTPRLNLKRLKNNAVDSINSHSFLLCSACTFVSVLISSKVVRCLGLPIKEFFIWADDIEYTERIFEAGYPCVYAMDSVVIHKTVSNYYPCIAEAPVSMAWRFYYQTRNTCYMKRRKTKYLLHFYLAVLNKYRLCVHRIKKRKDGDKKAFLAAVRKGCWDGLKFKPQIEYI